MRSKKKCFLHFFPYGQKFSSVSDHVRVKRKTNMKKATKIRFFVAFYAAVFCSKYLTFYNNYVIIILLIYRGMKIRFLDRF